MENITEAADITILNYPSGGPGNLPSPYLFPVPVTVPIPNLVRCFHDIVKKHPDRHWQDLLKSLLTVVTLLPKYEKKILEKILTDSSGPSWFIQDSYFRFFLEASIFSPYQKGWWLTADYRYTGDDVLSLAQFSRGGDELDALEFGARCLGVNFDTDNVIQCGECEGSAFIRNSHAYPGFYSNSIVEQILGRPNDIHIFNNECGQASFYLFSWHLKRGSIRLFLTLQQDSKTGERVWRYIAPPDKYMIYNRHRITHSDSGAEVHIHDQIGRAQCSNSEHAIATWAGDLSIHDRLDWSFLKGKGKVVKYFFDQNYADSMRIGAHLVKMFKQFGVSLKLHPVADMRL